MHTLPANIVSAAFAASNGELAWPRASIEQAILSVRDAALATLGGEVWLVSEPGRWHGLIPQCSGGPPAVWSWSTGERDPAESWSAYCERTAQKSIHNVRTMSVESETPAELHARLRFNLTYISAAGA